MKDFFGTELGVGDTIAYPFGANRAMAVSTITEVSEKSITVETFKGYFQTFKAAKQVFRKPT